ncbi:MAG: hypothetical protein QOH93_2347 [Chloroflexia bacterium]|nr:hypothetical protein [Chloroflexia bacterium]
MISQDQTQTHKTTQERLAELLALLSRDQVRFVRAMLSCKDKKEAALEVKLQPNTVYKWPDYIDEVLHLIALDEVQAALDLRRKALVKAVLIKLEGLDSEEEAVRQKVASEIISAELDRKTSPRMASTLPGEAMPEAYPTGAPLQSSGGEMGQRIERFLMEAPEEERVDFISEYIALIDKFIN